ncbi:MAG: type II secretion system protein F [bacterium]|nr:MAG: type II secretion system protein F [bacterium]
MPVFVYKYQTRVGIKTGEIDVETIEAAQAFLRKQRITPKSLKPKPKDLLAFMGASPPSQKELVVFVRQFSTMIDAGLPLVQCLEILGGQAQNQFFAKSIMEVKARIEQGDTFADSLRRHPKIFDTLFCNMVEAGEVGGILDIILQRLAAYIEKAAALRGKIKSAMVYPISIMVIATVVVVFLLVFIIPSFASMFQEMGGRELPAVTRSVMFISDTMIGYWYVFVGGPVGIVFLLRKIYSTDKGHLMLDKIILRVPVLGMLVQKVAVAKFSRTMSTLISSGVPIIEGLEITAKTSGNRVIEDSVIEVIEDIKQGKGLADPLRMQGVFPPMVVQMIEVGEQTGALDTMLSKIADFYDQEVDDAVDALTSLMEPLLMVFLGVVVGYVVIAMYMPIFQMGAGV